MYIYMSNYIEKLHLLKDIKVFHLMGLQIIHNFTINDDINILKNELKYLQNEYNNLQMKRKINSNPWYLYKPKRSKHVFKLC